MIGFLKRQWFLTTLALLIAAGMLLGARGYADALSSWTEFFSPRMLTSGVVFLMAFSLDSRRLGAAFHAPGPVLLGFGMNFGVVPLFAWALAPLQQTDDFRCGLMIAASVPCTLAAASVMTRRAGGNDAVSLLVTLATNALCFLLTPLWLAISTATKVELDPRRMMLDLLLTVLVPTVCGQLIRQPATIKSFADRHKATINALAQVLIEVTVFTAALRAGRTLYDAGLGAGPIAGSPSAAASALTASAVVIVWGSCMLVHLAGLAGGLVLARSFGLRPADRAPVAFAGSQKTLPIGLYISTAPAMFGASHPFALFPMLLYHASQLFLDTLIADRLAKPAAEPRPAPQPAVAEAGGASS